MVVELVFILQGFFSVEFPALDKFKATEAVLNRRNAVVSPRAWEAAAAGCCYKLNCGAAFCTALVQVGWVLLFMDAGVIFLLPLLITGRRLRTFSWQRAGL